MDHRTEPEELAEAHDEWTPLLRIDAIGVTTHDDRLVEVNAYDPHLERDQGAASLHVALGETMLTFQHRLELHRTFPHARRADVERLHGREPRDTDLVALVSVAHRDLVRRDRVRT